MVGEYEDWVMIRLSESFEAGKRFAETGEFPEIPDQKEFDDLCNKVKTEKFSFTILALSDYLSKLFDRKHNYNTIAEAFKAGLTACFRAMLNHNNGDITGFQAGWILNKFFDEQKNLEFFKIVDYSNMLYPQYEENFDKTITKETWKFLQNKADYMLRDQDFHGVNPDVMEHWRKIAEGEIPFGFTVRER
jgi:hypothetical protein